MAAKEADNRLEGPPSGDFDIPPAIACARCGQANCDGCEPDPPEFEEESRQVAVLPWERQTTRTHGSFLETAELTAVNPRAAFGGLGEGPLAGALAFAVLCEVWAVASFTLLWGAVFYGLFPYIARQMISSPLVLMVAGVILVTLIAFVVFVHVLWGLGLEWGIKRAGGQANINLGVRFGLYACGWDLLTSPAGIIFQWRTSGLRQGLRNVRASTKAPRPSMNAYLDECRKLDPKQRKSAVWTAVWLGLVGLGGAGFLLFATLLVAWLPWAF